ncbi:MAG: succinate dehydrogenase [Verrucomicrobia bacterium]|nr:succinate dehydrogenase [Verrucomicrobiota bacterium]
MKWLIDTVTSSIGKKLVMAVTGLGFCVFLILHMLGNLTIYAGKQVFNAYAGHLHSLGILLNVAELGLLCLAAAHVTTGGILFYGNWRARPIRSRVKRSSGGRTIGSMTMPYTGIGILLFVVFHLLNFHFVDKTQRTIFEIVSDAFVNPGYVALYIVAMEAVAIHVSHGFWSAFQTLGFDHPKYTPLVRVASVAFSLVIGFGFGFIPVYA